MIVVATDKTEQNRAILDPWTVVHFGVGLAMGLAGVGAGTTAALGAGYEVAEQLFERSEAGQKLFSTSGPESLGNVAADLAVYAVGWHLGRKWNA